jgi:hypothetical protein
MYVHVENETDQTSFSRLRTRMEAALDHQERSPAEDRSTGGAANGHTP